MKIQCPLCMQMMEEHEKCGFKCTNQKCRYYDASNHYFNLPEDNLEVTDTCEEAKHKRYYWKKQGESFMIRTDFDKKYAYAL